MRLHTGLLQLPLHQLTKKLSLCTSTVTTAGPLVITMTSIISSPYCYCYHNASCYCLIAAGVWSQINGEVRIFGTPVDIVCFVYSMDQKLRGRTHATTR